MSSSWSRRILLVCAVVLAGAALAAAAPYASGHDVPASPAAAPAALAQIPCGLTGERLVDPRVVEGRGDINVRATYRYQCPEQTRQAHFFLVVENSARLGDRGGWSGRQLVTNVRDGLKKFVDPFDYAAGSKGGLITFTRTAHVVTDLDAGKQVLKAAIDGFNANAGNNASGITDAITEATTRLAASGGGPDVLKVIMILQAGAAITADTEEIPVACQAAKDKGIIIGLMMLEGVDNPLSACTTPGWSRGTGRDNGEDVPDDLTELANALIHGNQPVKVEYCDALVPAFDLVKNSASPRNPDTTVLDEICWEDAAPPPPEGYTVTYRLRPDEETTRAITSTSNEAVVRLTFIDSSTAEVVLAIPDVCIHPRGDTTFCEPFIRALTPTAAPTVPPSYTETPTPVATEVPTGVPTGAPTEPPVTPTTTIPPSEPPPTVLTPGTDETPAPTVPAPTEVPGYRIYLPSTLKGYALPPSGS